MANTINWFEIPVTNFERARKFYSELLGSPIEKTEMGGLLMGFFPYQDRGDVSGAIIHGEGHVSSDKGVLIYLNGGDDLSGMLSKVEKAGGKVVVPKTLINEDIGFFSIFFDTEGNKIAIHSRK